MTAARSIIRFQRNDTLSVAMLSYGLDKGPALDLLERAERYPIAAIALRAIRARAAISFLKAIDQYALDSLGLPARAIAFQSSNAWDAHGAADFGM
ncbi:MAG TPA: hypothetical protein VKA12_12275, partial [Roseiarcus sp.]|nr:hypothetical protein [Roseiarcus sp.]